MKRLVSFIIAFAMLAVLPAAAENVQAAGPVDEAQGSLAGYIIVLHTADTLGQAGEGLGFARVSEAKARFEEEGAAVLLLDDGGALPEEGGEAGEIARAMTEAGYDAMVPAASDFSQGLEQLTALKDGAGFPLLAANALDAEGERLLSGSIIVDKDGLRIGVFGLTDAPDAGGVSVTDAEKAAASAVSTLRGEGCDVVVALARLAADGSGVTAHALADAVTGINIIIDMNAAAPAQGQWTAGGTLIVSGAARMASIGIVAIDPMGRAAAMTMDGSWFE